MSQEFPKTIEIYALSDPITGMLRYVGKATRAIGRLSRHLSEKTNHHKSRWIQSLVAHGLKPKLEIIERIEINSEEEWQPIERFWIAYLRFIGCPRSLGRRLGEKRF